MITRPTFFLLFISLLSLEISGEECQRNSSSVDFVALNVKGLDRRPEKFIYWPQGGDPRLDNIDEDHGKYGFDERSINPTKIYGFVPVEKGWEFRQEDKCTFRRIDNMCVLEISFVAHRSASYRLYEESEELDLWLSYPYPLSYRDGSCSFAEFTKVENMEVQRVRATRGSTAISEIMKDEWETEGQGFFIGFAEGEEFSETEATFVANGFHFTVGIIKPAEDVVELPLTDIVEIRRTESNLPTGVSEEFGLLDLLRDATLVKAR